MLKINTTPREALTLLQLKVSKSPGATTKYRGLYHLLVKAKKEVQKRPRLNGVFFIVKYLL